MHLPSSVPRYDEVPLPMFDQLERRYILPDLSRRLSSWSKAAEVERRLDHFEWLVHVARRPDGIQSLVLDLASAYLLSFESALQVLQAERFSTGFEKWLSSLPANDLTFRGLRTLRHLEAHVRAGALTQRQLGGHSRFTGGEGGSNIGWRWAPISIAEFRALRTPRISEAELPDWNRQLEEYLVMDLMRAGVQSLVAVFEEAEK
jgi:hypothetical protein